MVIAHVVSCLTTGGAEKLVADMSRILDKSGFKVKVISILKPKGIPYEILKKNNIEIIELNYKSKFDIRIAYDIYTQTKDCDIVHTHTFYAQLYSAVFVSKDKLITTEHNTYNKRRKIKLFKVLEYIMYKKYKNIICITDATEKSLNNWLKSTRKKTIVINNGIDLELYKNAEAVDKSFFGVNEEKYILTCVASLTQQKNHKRLINSMKDVNKNINLFIVGDGVLREELIEEVKKLGLENRVFFLGNKSNVANILKASDGFIIPSLWEGFGLVAVEAAATGIPLIISDVPGLNSLFNENMVYKINPNDEYNISKVINEVYLMKSNNRIVNLDELNKYSIHNMINKYIDIYLSMCNLIRGKKEKG